MLYFKNYLQEEVLPTAQVKDGSFDVEKPEVRDQINATLTSVCARVAVTPYVVYNKISKVLAYFHIILPKRMYLEGDRGVDVVPLRQFGLKMGMTDKGEFVSEVPPTHYLYLKYQMAGRGYVVVAKIVSKEELDGLLANAERSLAEEQLDETPDTKRKGYRGPAPKGTLADPEVKKHMRDLKKKFPGKSGPLKPFKQEEMKESAMDKAKARIDAAFTPDKVKAMFKKVDDNKKKEMASDKFKNWKKGVKVYTNEESQLDELSAELVGRVHNKRLEKGQVPSKTLRNAVRKKWLESQVGKLKK